NYKEELRWNWNTPIALSPNEKGTIYIGAQFLFRSRDHGQTWDRISPDLTTNDPEKQKQEQSGGVTVDNSAAEMHTTIYSISESPRNANLVWVGTDDGNVQITRDGGKTWTNVVGNIRGLPKNAWVSYIDAGHFEEGTAYATFDAHTFGDMRPYVYKTTDFGQTWTPLVSEGSPVRGYAHVVREDLVNRDLLFVGTEFGLWMSLDGGHQWAQYKGGDMPSVAVRDLAIHPRDHDLMIEVLDPDGKVLGVIPSSKRRGLSRTTWSMRLQPPRVPPAASAAFGAAFGPRVLPGTYTVRMTKDKQVYATQLQVIADLRSTHTAEDRKQQFDLALKLRDQLGEMSFAVDKINQMRLALDERASKLAGEDPLRKRLQDASAQVHEL